VDGDIGSLAVDDREFAARIHKQWQTGTIWECCESSRFMQVREEKTEGASDEFNH
jgi:hypothetical protein